MNDFVASLMLLGALSGGNSLPFWSTTGQYGLMPGSSGALAVVQAGTSYDESKTFQWKWGVSLAANTDPAVMVDQCYASLRWKALSLDLGMKHPDLYFMASDSRLGSLSVTGGRVAESGNARSMPGYRINLDPVAVPFTGRHLFIYGSFGDFKTLDKRYVQGALVHRTRAFLMLSIAERFEFHLGLDHYGIWGGTSPVYGPMPITFDNYFRVITGRNASAAGSHSDRMNVIGDQGGAELFKWKWKGDGWSVTLQHDIPYNDRSGIELGNFPDGVNTLHFGFEDKDRWVSDLLYEYHYTMYQSGSIHDNEFDENGNFRQWTPDLNFRGMDDYFNNGEYRSGWTYYGRTIGHPLFFPKGTRSGTWDPSGIVQGVENNRLQAHHIGVSGKLFRKAPYKLMLTYSFNYGTYSASYAGESPRQKPWGSVKETPLRQVSAAFTGEVPEIFGVRGLTLLYGIFADKGSVLPDCAGATLGLIYTLH